MIGAIGIVLLAAFVLLCLAGWRIYAGRARLRVAGMESLESPEVAADFDRVAAWPQFRLLRRYVAGRALCLAQQGEAVDIGCGPGHLVFHLANRAPELHLTGVDLSDEVLARAMKRAVGCSLTDRVAFRKGSAQQLPFPDSTLDLVVSSLSLHHWSGPAAVLDEVSRVLRPGGAFCLFDLRRDLPAPSYVLLWFATHVVVPRALRQAREPMASRDAAYTPQEVRELAEASSLSGWEVHGGPLWLTIEGRTTAGT